MFIHAAHNFDPCLHVSLTYSKALALLTLWLKSPIYHDSILFTWAQRQPPGYFLGWPGWGGGGLGVGGLLGLGGSVGSGTVGGGPVCGRSRGGRDCGGCRACWAIFPCLSSFTITRFSILLLCEYLSCVGESQTEVRWILLLMRRDLKDVASFIEIRY